MKARMKWIVALAALAVGVVWLLGERTKAAGPEPAAEADRVAELEREVQALRQTVARLEQRLAAVELRDAQQVLNMTEGVVPQSYEPVPAPSWKQKYRPQGEINGVPYYILPLNDRPAATVPAGQR